VNSLHGIESMEKFSSMGG